MSSKRSTDGHSSNAASQAAPKPEGRLAAKAKNNLVALGSAAVFTVYGAGFMRTKAAAARFENDADDRRPPLPGARTGPVRPSDAAPQSAVPSSVASSATVGTKSSAPVASPTSPVAAQSVATAPSRADSAKVDVASQTKPAASSTAPASAPVAAIAMPAPQQAVAATPPSVSAPVQAPSAPAAPARDTSSNSNKTAAADSVAQAEPRPLKDGTFTGWGTSRHGDIQATVMIKNGKIMFAAISECMTQYSCSWITPLPPQVVARQSAEVDYVSGATQSTIAFYRAVLEAMSKAK